jgi:hypothetical protein
MIGLMWFGNKLVYFFGVERILDIGLLAIPHPSAVIFDLWWPVIILIMCWLVGYMIIENLKLAGIIYHSQIQSESNIPQPILHRLSTILGVSASRSCIFCPQYWAFLQHII